MWHERTMKPYLGDTPTRCHGTSVLSAGHCKDKYVWTNMFMFWVNRNRALIMAALSAALCNRAGHYIFALWFLSFFLLSFFSSPNLSGRRLDVYHTSAPGVALVRI